MTSAIARPRYVHCLALAILLCGCRGSTPSAPVRAVDLIHELDRAEKRPPDGFTLGVHERDGIARPAIEAAAPSRLTIPLPLPNHGVFHAFVALADAPAGATAPSVRLRVGISDHRVYEGLTELLIAQGTRHWLDLNVDLSAYAGWKVSLFYRPNAVVWRLVLAADAVDGVPGRVLWGTPEITTDAAAARHYATEERRGRTATEERPRKNTEEH